MLVKYPTASVAMKSRFVLIILAASKNLSDATPTNGLYATTAGAGSTVGSCPWKDKSVI